MNSYSAFFSKSNLILPRHDSPFPVYPSLQVQLWAIGVGAMRIYVTIMASFAAFVDI